MNERLQELARQAGFYASPEVEKFEKFAELIVQECVNVLHDNELWSRDVSHVFKEHFGVEE